MLLKKGSDTKSKNKVFNRKTSNYLNKVSSNGEIQFDVVDEDAEFFGTLPEDERKNKTQQKESGANSFLKVPSPLNNAKGYGNQLIIPGKEKKPATTPSGRNSNKPMIVVDFLGCINGDRKIEEDSDLQSVDLSELDKLEASLTEEQIFEMLASKHRFQDVGKILHIGIIDYLTSFGCFKAGELKVKSLTA